MDVSALRTISMIGTQLVQRSRLGKDFIFKSLRLASASSVPLHATGIYELSHNVKQAVNALSQLEQPSSSQVSDTSKAAKKVESALKPLKQALLACTLLHHADRDVKLLVTICITETFRLMAPEPPFEDKDLRDIFKVIISSFEELDDTTSPYFSKRAKILETVAKCKCCVIMLDLKLKDLVSDMFDVLFRIVREDHPKSLINDISSIMTHIIYEEASHELSEVILRNFIKADKGEPSADSRLAEYIIINCSDALKPFICGFLTSCVLDRDTVVCDLKEFYHEIIIKIFQCAPEMLLAFIPTLTRELLTDQVDVRIKAVNLVGKLFAVPGHHIAEKCGNLFVEFLKRFSDKSPDVRYSALQCATAFYLANPSGDESRKIITAIEDRLLDFEDRVRKEAVLVACEICRSNLRVVPSSMISRVAERLRDKKISVRKMALEKMIELYQDYCNKCLESKMTINDHFEQIPCKILILSYDRDCKEFRQQNMEFVFSNTLFPAHLPLEERTMHWIHLFSLFSPLHKKALNCILSQKRRLQVEMKGYLSLHRIQKENCSEDAQRRLKSSFMEMAASFPDPLKAEECFNKLNQMKDNNIFKLLADLLEEPSIFTAQAIRDELLNIVGESHPSFEFLQSLSVKCSFSIFSSENIQYILDFLCRNIINAKCLVDSSIELLWVIASNFPVLLKGSEQQFLILLGQMNPVNDKLLEVIVKAGPYISFRISDVYPFLKTICLKGTRKQAKIAVSAIAGLIESSNKYKFLDLYEELISSLHEGSNLPTVLQSLSCIAQYSVSTYETRDEEITLFVLEKLFQEQQSDDIMPSDDDSFCSFHCRLKICGLKTLVNRFLPHGGNNVGKPIDDLLNFLSQCMQDYDSNSGLISCESDKAHFRLAAAKLILKLSRRWDSQIKSDIFRTTVMMANDSSEVVRKSFIDKIHKLLKKRVIPIRYACAFAVAAKDCIKDIRENAHNYLAEFIKEYSREAQIQQTSAVQGAVTNYPAYILVYLIHALAHDSDFPAEICEDEEVYACFCSPLFSVLEAVVNARVMDGDMHLMYNALLYVYSILRAIRRSEDAVDMQITTRIHMLADLGLFIVKKLNHDSISLSNAPGQILLPLSLYRISRNKKSDEMNSKFLTSPFSECFWWGVFNTYKSNNTLPSKTITRRGRKCQDDGRQLNVGQYKTIDLTSRKGVGMEITNKTESKIQRSNAASQQNNKRAASPSVAAPVGLHECSSINKKQKFISMEKKQLSSYDSLSAIDSQVISISANNELGCISSIACITDSSTAEKTEDRLPSEPNKSHLATCGIDIEEPSTVQSLDKSAVTSAHLETNAEPSKEAKETKRRYATRSSSALEVVKTNQIDVQRRTRRQRV